MSISLLHIFIVINQEQKMRLDKFLAIKLHDLSRSRLQSLIKNGFVKIDNINCQDLSLKTKEGQRIEVIIPPLIEATPSPQNIPLTIQYEDNDVIVINKSAGMVVHPAPGNLEGTLVNALLSHCGESLSGINGVKRPGIVHRLDKETSGLLVAAKHDKAHHFLAHQLATREMGRVYIALVWGMLPSSQGTLEGYIGRDPHNRQRMAIRQTGKFARTHYKVLKIFGRIASLIECRLETGRTHQIRVQLAKSGHSLIGDILYGKPPKAFPLILKTFLSENWSKGRQSLHAKELSFIHPTTHKKLHFSVELPKDIRDLIDVLNLL
ncbi:MAG: RluA family pseudouridine synthase [Alphaproteobacteria bacterium]|nr:RluA family pseudouridine synthase [Alphaproteobacteria bacterium]